MAPDDGLAPSAGFRFGVEIQGLVVGWFHECTSISVDRAVVPYEEGGVSSHTVQLPGQVSYTKVTLRGGLAGGVLWEWFQSGQYDAATPRRNVTVVVYDATGRETVRWEMLNCLPLRWLGPPYATGAARVAVEELQIGWGEAGASLATVQRAAGEGTAAGAQGDLAAAPDLPALAQKIYELLRQDLRIERERVGQRRT